MASFSSDWEEPMWKWSSHKGKQTREMELLDPVDSPFGGGGGGESLGQLSFAYNQNNPGS